MKCILLVPLFFLPWLSAHAGPAAGAELGKAMDGMAITDPAERAFYQKLQADSAGATDTSAELIPVKRGWVERVFCDAELLKKITCTELVMRDLLIEGPIDISNAKVGVPILMSECTIAVPTDSDKGIKARNCDLVAWVFQKCRIPMFEGDGCDVRNDFVVEPGCEFMGELRLPNSRIGGLFSVQSSRFRASGGQDRAINLENSEIKGGVRLTDNATLAGCLILTGTKLKKLEITGNVKLDGSLQKERFAILANWAEIEGSLCMEDHLEITGNLSFQGTKLGGSLHAANIFILANGGTAWLMDDATVGGTFGVRKVIIQKQIKDEAHTTGLSLKRVRVAGDLDLQEDELGGFFLSIDADGFTCGGKIYMENNKFSGEMRFLGARVTEDVVFLKSSYLAYGTDQTTSINLNGASVGCSLKIADSDKVEGLITLHSITVQSDLTIYDNAFDRSAIDLRQARAGRFLIHMNGNKPSRVWLDGFIYQRIAFRDDQFTNQDRLGKPAKKTKLSEKEQSEAITEKLLNATHALLDLSTPSVPFEPQPYEQMATTMRSMGHERIARAILTRMSTERANVSDCTGWEYLWYRFIGRIVGYGYNPSWAFMCSLVIIGIGWFFFWLAWKNQILVTEDENKAAAIHSPRPRYWVHSLAYSIEKFTPFLDLGVAKRWQPVNQWSEVKPWKIRLLHYYLWLHIIAGWVLASLWVGALTGIAH